MGGEESGVGEEWRCGRNLSNGRGDVRNKDDSDGFELGKCHLLCICL